MKERGPIFYDGGGGVRWRRQRAGSWKFSGALLTLLLAVFFSSISRLAVELPCWPAFPIPARSIARSNSRRLRKLFPAVKGGAAASRNLGKVPASYDPLRAGYYVSWDSNSLASLKRHYKDLDVLIPRAGCMP